MRKQDIIEGIILAAGYGTRLKEITKGKPKQLLNIHGLPLIMYPIMNLIKIGASKIYIVVNKENKDYIYNIVRNAEKLVDIELVINNQPERENGYSFIIGIEATETNDIILLMSDHIHVVDILHKLIDQYLSKKPYIIVGGDSRPTYIDVTEATKVYAEANVVKDIGKNLKKWTHIDIGIFIVNKENVIEYLKELKNTVEKITISQIVLELARTNKVFVGDIKGYPWSEIDTPRDLEEVLYGNRRQVVEQALSRLIEIKNTCIQQHSYPPSCIVGIIQIISPSLTSSLLNTCLPFLNTHNNGILSFNTLNSGRSFSTSSKTSFTLALLLLITIKS